VQVTLQPLQMDLLRCEHILQMRMLSTLLNQAQDVQPAQATRSSKRLRQPRLLPVMQEHMEVKPLLLTPQVAHLARPLLPPEA
jgi:hypothetical protein